MAQRSLRRGSHACTAAHPEVKGRGVLVVANDEIHFAREVAKTNTTQVGTFRATHRGLAGLVTRDESPDLVLLDIRLGNRSGLDLFHELRAIDPKLLVVFIFVD